MPDIIEQNKKKGVLAAVLYTFRQGKSAAPILGLTALIIGAISAPQGTLIRLPGAAFLAEKFVSVGLLRPPEGTTMEAYLKALNDEQKGTPDEIRRRMRTDQAIPNPRRSRVQMVSGGYLNDSYGINYENIAKDRGKSIKGVMNPKESEDSENALPVDENAFQRGLVETAFAQAVSGGEGAQAGRGAGEYGGAQYPGGLQDVGGLGSGKPTAGSSGLLVHSEPIAEKAVNPDSDVVDDALRATRAPTTGRAKVSSGVKGKSRYMRGSRQKLVAGGSSVSRPSGDRKTAMYELSMARAFSVAAAKTDDVGDAGNYMMKDTAGLIFDGGRQPGSKGSIAGGAGGSGASVSCDADCEQLQEDARLMEENLSKCTEATEAHENAQTDAAGKMQDASEDARRTAERCLDKAKRKDDMWRNLTRCVRRIWRCRAEYNRAKAEWQNAKRELDQKAGVARMHCEESNRHAAAIGEGCTALRDGQNTAVLFNCDEHANNIRRMCP